MVPALHETTFLDRTVVERVFAWYYAGAYERLHGRPLRKYPRHCILHLVSRLVRCTSRSRNHRAGGRSGSLRACQFYRRELPALRAVLSKFTLRPEVIIIDGYVWLGDWDHPGLGAHLHKALGGSVAVIGVTKKLFLRGPAVQTIRRGNSARLLYVSTAGMDLNEAAARIVELHGEFRVPTLLKRVDRLCRGCPDIVQSELVKRSPKPTTSAALTSNII